MSLLLLLFVFIISTNHLTGINDILKLWVYLREATTKRNALFGPLVSLLLLLFMFIISTNHLSHFYRYY